MGIKQDVLKFKKVLRNRINKSIKSGGYKKQSETFEVLGCSWEFFKSHIESSFTEEMTWDNHGEWHIDHILPCASFNLINEEEQKKPGA